MAKYKYAYPTKIFTKNFSALPIYRNPLMPNPLHSNGFISLVKQISTCFHQRKMGLSESF